MRKSTGSNQLTYAPGVITDRLRLAVWERDDFTCVECGVGGDLTTDHRIPKSMGGQTVLDNLQTLCRPCNSAKGAKTELGTAAKVIACIKAGLVTEAEASRGFKLSRERIRQLVADAKRQGLLADETK